LGLPHLVVSNTPAADFCGRVRVNYFTLSRESATCRRSPAISSAAFDTRPPDLPPASLMDTDFVVTGQLVRRRRPRIRFLYIGPHLCSTLPSDPTSRWRPCASLPFTSIRLRRDLHPLAAEHARRTRLRPREARGHFSLESSQPSLVDRTARAPEQSRESATLAAPQYGSR